MTRCNSYRSSNQKKRSGSNGVGSFFRYRNSAPSMIFLAIRQRHQQRLRLEIEVKAEVQSPGRAGLHGGLVDVGLPGAGGEMIESAESRRSAEGGPPTPNPYSLLPTPKSLFQLLPCRSLRHFRVEAEALRHYNRIMRRPMIMTSDPVSFRPCFFIVNTPPRSVA